MKVIILRGWSLSVHFLQGGSELARHPLYGLRYLRSPVTVNSEEETSDFRSWRGGNWFFLESGHPVGKYLLFMIKIGDIPFRKWIKSIFFLQKNLLLPHSLSWKMQITNSCLTRQTSITNFSQDINTVNSCKLAVNTVTWILGNNAGYLDDTVG